MSKMGKDLIESGREMSAQLRGEAPATYKVHVPKTVDVKRVRAKLGLTQQEFAAQFGFAYDALREWESGRRQPERTARTFLTVIDRIPKQVQKALAGGDD